MADDYLLEMKNITKIFPPNTVANYRVNFNVRRGEIHALLGENGAGKTTLVKILFGEYKPDEGEIFYKGRRIRIRSPRDAIRLGIWLVHQHFRLVETLTVAENVALGFSKDLIRPVENIRGRIASLSKKYHLEIDPDARIWQLSAGERQRVELLKALYADAELLVLDEPTTALAPPEREGLYSIMDRMRGEGKAIVFITHRLDEIGICDRVTVLRRGRVVRTIEGSDMDSGQLARLMLGEGVSFELGDRRPSYGLSRQPLLEVSNLWVRGDRGEFAVRGVSLAVHAGEVVGIAGIAGNGQRELAEAIVGLRGIERGDVSVLGRGAKGRSPRGLADLGLAYVPEDRVGMGVALDLSVLDNFILRKYHRKEYLKLGFLIDYEKFVGELKEAIRKYGIKTPDIYKPAGTLSGGNIQKLIIARELSSGARLIVAMYPTQGLDVATALQVRRLLLEERNRGTGVLLVSEDLNELLGLSDRILVIYRGSIVGEFGAANMDLKRIGRLMAGAEEARVIVGR